MQVFVFVFLVRSRFFNVRFMAHCQFEHHDFGFVRDDDIGTRCFVEYFIYWTECRWRRIHVQCLIFGDVGSYPVWYYFQDSVVSSGISCQSCWWWAVRKFKIILIIIIMTLSWSWPIRWVHQNWITFSGAHPVLDIGVWTSSTIFWGWLSRR